MDGQKSPATQMRDVIRGHQRSSVQKSPSTQMSHAERDAGRSHRSVRCGHLTAWCARARGASTFSVAHVDAPRARVAKLSDPTVHYGPLRHDSESVLVERVGRAARLPGEWLARVERHLAEVRRTESAPVRHVQGLVREDAHASGVVGGGDVGHHYGERVGDPCIHMGGAARRPKRCAHHGEKCGRRDTGAARRGRRPAVWLAYRALPRSNRCSNRWRRSGSAARPRSSSPAPPRQARPGAPGF